MDAVGLTRYVVSFGPGPVGIVLLNVSGYAIVSRLACLPNGQAGQGSRGGVTIGSLVVGVAATCEDAREAAVCEFDTVRKAIALAARPVRVIFQRLACVLRPLPSLLPLPVWRGFVACRTLAIAEADTVKIGTGDATCLLLHAKRGNGYRLVLRWAQSAVFEILEFPSPTGGHSREILTLHDDAVVVDGHNARESESRDHAQGSIHVHLSHTVITAELRFEGAAAACDFKKMLLMVRFPGEIEEQAKGVTGPVVIHRGPLRQWRSYLKLPPVGRWKPFEFRLKSDGSFQVRWA